MLTAPAPPGSSLRQHRSHDSARAAAPAGLSVSTVDREVVLVTTLQSVGIYVVVDARPAHFDGAVEDIDDRAT